MRYNIVKKYNVYQRIFLINALYVMIDKKFDRSTEILNSSYILYEKIENTCYDSSVLLFKI